MSSSVRRGRGSAAVGILLLIVALGLAAIAIFFIHEQNSAKPSTPNVVAPEKATSKADKPRADAEANRNKVAERAGINAPKKAEKGIHFTVSCIDATDASKPISGLVVSAAPAIPTGTAKEYLTTATTDDHGVAHFDDLPYTIYEVWATPTGHVPLNQRGIRDGRKVELLFAKGAAFSGTLLDAESGKPIAGAYVQVSSDFGAGAVMKRIQGAKRQGVDPEDIQGHERIGEPPAFFRTDATSDAEGHFQIATGIPTGVQVVVNVDHNEFDQFNDMFEQKDTTPVTREYKLLRCTEIFGKVVADENGEPISGVKVQAGQGGIPINVLSLLQGAADSDSVVESTTDANGNYRLKNMKRGPQYVCVHYPGRDDYAQRFEAKGNDPVQHDIRLKRAAGMSGQVVDNAYNPIEGVAIYWVFPEQSVLGKAGLPPEPSTRTAADGTFQLRGLPPGRSFNVLARHPDYVNAEQDHFVLQPGELMPKVQIMMNHGGSITGTVVDSAHQPLAGASIVARPVKPTGPPLSAVISGKDGSFVVNNTQPAMFELTCEAPGYCKAITANVRDVATGVQFTMLKEATYAGHLLGGDGQPVTKFRVRMRPSDLPQPHDLRSENYHDKDGKFLVKGLAPGLWDLEFSADNSTPLVVSHLAVKEAEHVENQELHFKDGDSVGGVVKSLSGKPIQAGLVRMEFLEAFSSNDKTYTTLQASTNANGEYEIKHLLAGRYKIWVTHPAFAPSGERELVVEDGPRVEQDFNLSKPASLRVVVRDEEGNTIPDAEAWLFQGNSPISSAEKKIGPGGLVGLDFGRNDPGRSGIAMGTDATNKGRPKVKVGESGEITFTRKEPGDWTLWITAEGYYKYTQRLTLEAGKEQVHEAQVKKLQPGLTKQDAYRRAMEDQQHPGKQFSRQGGANGGANGKNPNAEAMEKLTPEERVVLRKQRDGEELNADEMKTLKTARQKMRGDDSSKKDEPTAKHGKKGGGGGAGMNGGAGGGGKKGGGKKGGKNGADPNADPQPGGNGGGASGGSNGGNR